MEKTQLTLIPDPVYRFPYDSLRRWATIPALQRSIYATTDSQQATSETGITRNAQFSANQLVIVRLNPGAILAAGTVCMSGRTREGNLQRHYGILATLFKRKKVVLITGMEIYIEGMHSQRC